MSVPHRINDSRIDDSLLGVVVLLVGGQDQGELAPVVDLSDLNLDLLTDRQHVLDGLDALTPR